jgi:DNA processing protein
MDAGGTTVAVLPRGLDRICPSSHARLAEKILARGGAIISEHPPGAEPFPHRFLERNRIVSGLARGTIIVECPAGSGSSATARFAAEQGRDVFIVPGPATHPNYAASHDFIRAGAELVTKPEHILEAFGLLELATSVAQTKRDYGALSPDERTVLLFLKELGAPADVDKIIQETKLEPQAVNVAISFLAIKEVIKETSVGYDIL